MARLFGRDDRSNFKNVAVGFQKALRLESWKVTTNAAPRFRNEGQTHSSSQIYSNSERGKRAG